MACGSSGLWFSSRRLVDLFDPRGRGVEARRAGSFSTVSVGFLLAADVWRGEGVGRCATSPASGGCSSYFTLTSDAAWSGAFQRVGDHDTDGLERNNDLVSCSSAELACRGARGPRPSSGCFGQLGHVEGREHGQRRPALFAAWRVHGGDCAVGDRAGDERAVNKARQVDFRRVARAAGDFEAAVGAVDGLADEGRKFPYGKGRSEGVLRFTHASAAPLTVCSARTMLRLASSILKSLYL